MTAAHCDWVVFSANGTGTLSICIIVNDTCLSKVKMQKQNV